MGIKIRYIVLAVFLACSGLINAQAEKESKAKILAFSDSVCRVVGVPPGLVREIGDNETGWRYMRSLSGTTANGDLQIIDNTFFYWYKKLKLKGGRTRKNYLIVGIYYLKHLYNIYGSWQKTRYSYARGHWKEPSEWTAMERRFMEKIDWTKYDKPVVPKIDTLSTPKQ